MPMAFQRVKNAVTTELPNGDANKAWKSLLSKFEPDNLTSATLLEKKFTETYLDNIEQDPEDFVEDLLTMRAQIAKASKQIITIDDDKFMRHVMTSLPEEYNETVKELKKLYTANVTACWS